MKRNHAFASPCEYHCIREHSLQQKRWYLQKMFSIFKIFIFWVSREGKRAKYDLKLPILLWFALYFQELYIISLRF